jgi:hypothetical protein
MMRPLALAALLAALVLPLPAGAQERRLEPIDEAARDASWASFKKRLIAAIEKRDRKFILGILDKNVRTGLEGGRGVAEFRKLWEVDSDASPLWQELRAVMALPAAYHRPDKGRAELCVPYVAVRWPQDMDAFKGGALIAGDVLVKSTPTAGADTVATLSYNMVEVADWEVDDRDEASKQKWVRIWLKSGIGFVPEEQIRSPVEHTACFVRGEKSWRMVGFGPAGGK